jgi:hypothetical protein
MALEGDGGAGVEVAASRLPEVFREVRRTAAPEAGLFMVIVIALP